MLRALALLFACGSILACGSSEPVAESAPQQAKRIYALRCAVCHGTAGKGDGPNAGGLEPRPTDFTSADWQRARSDQQIEEVILGGGAAVGKSSAMPPNQDLAAQRDVLTELRARVRAFARK